MSRKLSAVEVICQKLMSFLLNKQKVKDDNQTGRGELNEKVQQKLVSANYFEKVFAERAIRDLQFLLDDEKNKLSDKWRAEIVSTKEGLEEVLGDLIESINILVRKEEYIEKDLDTVDAKCSLIREIFERVKFICLRTELIREM